jgi:hypothetical protein
VNRFGGVTPGRAVDAMTQDNQANMKTTTRTIWPRILPALVAFLLVAFPSPSFGATSVQFTVETLLADENQTRATLNTPRHEINSSTWQDWQRKPGAPAPIPSIGHTMLNKVLACPPKLWLASGRGIR